MDLVHISVGSAAVVVVLGMGVVFLGLILLMLVVQIMSKYFIAKQGKEKAAAAEERVLEAAPVRKADPAPGTAGELKLYDTDPREAAMIMAIVADELKVPLNQLRFRSIRQVKEHIE